MSSDASPVNSADLDQINLEAALRDAEVAIGRSIDLTRRLTELADELTAERARCAELATELEASDRAHQALRASRTYRAALLLAVPGRLVRRVRRPR